MSRNEKILTYAILTVVGLEVLRHYTWRPDPNKPKPVKPVNTIGMSINTSVSRRA